MSRLRFAKMSGAGNDFVVADNRQGQVPGDAGAFAARVCDRRRGVGADGLLLVEPSARKAFRMRYYNADGSEADMCGNGGRCIARYAAMIGAAGESMEFENLAGDFRAQVLPGGLVSLQMTSPKGMKLDWAVEAGSRGVTGHYLNTGVPHFVVPVEDVEAVPVEALGRELRFHAAFGPKGANASFCQVLSRHALKLRTYERGVEGETLACGTGAVAAAVLMAALGRCDAPVEVRTRGGESLQVDFQLEGQEASGVFLKGAVEITFEGELDLERYAAAASWPAAAQA